jgi:hypothetical protein
MTVLIPPCCPEPNGHYFQNLLRERTPEVWYRLALLQVMVSYAGILNIDDERSAV